MAVLEIGGQYPLVLGYGEGCFFDVDDAEPKLIYNLLKPTPEEIADFSAGSAFEIRFVELGGIIWTAHKCGSQQWNDCPYNPRLSKLTAGFPTLERPEDGLGLTMILTDVLGARIKALRLVGLSHKFSAVLLETAARLRETPLSDADYQRTLAEVPRKYSSRQLADMATHYCKIKGR